MTTSGSSSSSPLSLVGVDLVELAAKGKLDPCVGREAEISRCLSVLSRRTKNNPVLLGEPGVGKTAILEGVALRIAEGRVPPSLRKVRELWSLSVGSLVAGTRLRGEFEERIFALLAEIEAKQEDIILFVDELHMLVGAGRSEGGNIDAASLLKPKLARGELRCIGATTESEYKNQIAGKDAAFERRWQPCQVLEPSEEVAIQMLQALRPRYEEHHRVEVLPEALELAVRLSARRVRNRSLPDKAVDIFDEACAAAANAGEEVMTRAHVQAVLDAWAPLPRAMKEDEEEDFGAGGPYVGGQPRWSPNSPNTENNEMASGMGWSWRRGLAHVLEALGLRRSRL